MPSVHSAATPVRKSRRSPAVEPAYMQLRRRALHARLTYGECAFLGYTRYVQDGRPLLSSGRGRQLRMIPCGLWSFVRFMSGFSETRQDIGAYIARALDLHAEPKTAAPVHRLQMLPPSEAIITIS